MSRSIPFAVLLVLAAPIFLAQPGESAARGRWAQPRAVADDPVPTPEPIDCPLCGGDARVHELRLRVIVRAWADLAAAAVILR